VKQDSGLERGLEWLSQGKYIFHATASLPLFTRSHVCLCIDPHSNLRALRVACLGGVTFLFGGRGALVESHWGNHQRIASCYLAKPGFATRTRFSPPHIQLFWLVADALRKPSTCTHPLRTRPLRARPQEALTEPSVELVRRTQGGKTIRLPTTNKSDVFHLVHNNHNTTLVQSTNTGSLH